MKGVVAFDSVHGNTKIVAEAIADQIRSEGHEVQLINLRESTPSGVAGDFLIVGSPTRAGRPTKEARSFVESLGVSWKGKPVGTFDTVGPISKDPEKRAKWMEMIDEGSKNAAIKLRDQCTEQGMRVTSVLHVAVVGFTGPIASDGVQMAKDYAHRFLSSMK